MLSDLDLLRTAKNDELVRQQGVHADFAEVLLKVDRMDKEGLLANVYRHTSTGTKDSPIDLVRVPGLTARGLARLAELGGSVTGG